MLTRRQQKDKRHLWSENRSAASFKRTNERVKVGEVDESVLVEVRAYRARLEEADVEVKVGEVEEPVGVVVRRAGEAGDVTANVADLGGE